METKNSIQHMVIFNLKYPVDSAETSKFLEDGRAILSAIPTVQNFEVLNQVSMKNNYNFGFSMFFDNQEAYTAYNEHPSHVGFVAERWLKEVTEFLEIDFTRI